MSHHQALKQSGLVVGVLALLLAGSECLSYGNQCQPPTPCPCEADGVCRPNAAWGYSKTRWRSWPGDPAGQQRTPAGDAATGTGDGQGLGPFELPLPEQEDLRGPAKKDKNKNEPENNAPAEEIPGDVPVPALPGPDALPAFDPQGSQLEMPGIPGMEDAPPTLPNSLRQAVISPRLPVRSMPRIARRRRLQQPAVIRPQAISPKVSPKVSLSAKQVNWQQSHSIQLINPASAMVTDAEENSLKRAIYYEASDQDSK